MQLLNYLELLIQFGEWNTIFIFDFAKDWNLFADIKNEKLLISMQICTWISDISDWL